MLKFSWITNKLKEKIYPYAHVKGIYVDDNNTVTLNETLSDLNDKILTQSEQSDWNETDISKISYIKNKPDSLPANGGNSDTVDNKHASDFVLSSAFNTHLSNKDAHIDLFNEKLGYDIANTLIKNIEYEPTSGIITITKLDNTTATIDLPVELLLKSGYYDGTNQNIVLVLKDDSEIKIPATALVDTHTGSTNDVIQVSISNDNVISAVIKNGSINKTLFSASLQTLLNKLETDDHIHSNKEILDNISQDNINAWNADTPVATAITTGIVRPDMQTIGIDGAGTLSALNWKTKNPSTTLNRWCKIVSVTLLTTRFEDFTAVILAQEVEMMMGSVLIHWNCNTEANNLGVEQMRNPCRMTAICGDGRTMSEFFEKCFFTECVQDDEAHVTYNLWYEPKNDYLTYTFSLLGCSGNYTHKYRVFTNPEYVTDTLTGKIVYPVKNTWPPVASMTSPGFVKPDGTTVTIDADGTIHSATPTEGVMPVSGGTFTGKVTGINNTDITSQFRNISFSDAVPTSVPDGEIVMVYET